VPGYGVFSWVNGGVMSKRSFTFETEIESDIEIETDNCKYISNILVSSEF
tara:strand:+ start:74300 stop:74449 length:150 start_codon:yes stop_codon:yes gene_type:complete